jgi:Fe-S cluster assembly protein SufD
MRTTIQSRGTVERYVAAFELLEARRRHEPTWLRAARGRAMDLFTGVGFPTTQDEDWRFTNVSAIAGYAFAPAGDEGADMPAATAVPRVPGLQGAVLVFVDGRHAPGLSVAGSGESGLIVGDLATMVRESPELVEPHLARYVSIGNRPFAALNTALFDGGAVVSVRPGSIVEGAVQLVFLAGGRSGVATHPRVLVLAGANSQVRLVETFAAAGDGARDYFTNAVTEIVAAEGAVVDHYRVQREGDAAFHVGLTHMQLGRSASVSSHAVALGGLIARHDAVAVLAGQGADCTLNGLYLARGQQLLDNHTEIDHASPNGTSHELYKGILDGRARGVFNGRIKVRPDAQKTDAKQTNKTLLLSDEAQINTKPQLEILANDVKCTHGATVGQLSQEALFYLRSRGIGEADARSLLIRAFALDVISRIRLEPVRVELDRLLAGRLPGSLAEKAFA